MGAIVVALILLAGQSPQTSFADASIRIGYPQPSGAMLPIWVMAETKLDQKYGVNKRALAKYLATSDGAILEEAYQAYRGVYPKIPYTTEDQVRSILAVADHPKAATAEPKEFFDNRFIKELEESGFIKELYGQR